jgi:hypothetical protein
MSDYLGREAAAGRPAGTVEDVVRQVLPGPGRFNIYAEVREAE